ncbi:MAG TPA: hypothetical protein VHW23_10305 [Kofleriaceae bacterium]|jgi:hypothetical protein|nr:hypothetical protein [Kofleriaceae bacterium]
MRMLITTLLACACACSGATPSGSRTCAGNLYDACLDEHDCMSGNCHNFVAGGFQVCSIPCTQGDDAACMTNDRGQKAMCVVSAGASTGICTPPAENDCTRAP